jgi:hypothetical protein
MISLIEISVERGAWKGFLSLLLVVCIYRTGKSGPRAGYAVIQMVCYNRDIVWNPEGLPKNDIHPSPAE